MKKLITHKLVKIKNMISRKNDAGRILYVKTDLIDVAHSDIDIFNEPHQIFKLWNLFGIYVNLIITF